MSKYRKLQNIFIRLVVPLLHTALWGAGISSCFLVAENVWPSVHKLNHGDLFWAISAIYVIYLLELFLNIIESACRHNMWVLNTRFMYLTAWMFLLFATTFCLGVVFTLNNSDSTGTIKCLYGIAITAVLLKLSDMLFSRSEDYFMMERAKIQINSDFA